LLEDVNGFERTVLLAVLPAASQNSSVRPYEFSLPVLLVINVLPLKTLAILPLKQSQAVFLVISPHAFVATLVTPSVSAVAVTHIV
jgi:hypothetical protein